MKLLEDLRDGNINPKEVLKDHAWFKTDLSEIKTRCKKLVDQNNTTTNVTNVFDSRRKILIFLEIILFCCLKLKTKQNVKKGLKF